MDTDYLACTHLVIVCCHATYIGARGEEYEEDAWLLQSFQRSDVSVKKPGEHVTFISHIAAAAQLCRDPEALLVYSGGHTSSPALSRGRTEAGSYNLVAQALVEGGGMVEPAKRPIAEEWATDSYQNLLFSILKFHQTVGAFPTRVTVVTHAFKERRFLELHAKAIKWPYSRLRVLGLNPPFTLEELEQTQWGEYERAYKLFAADPYGVRAPLADKRAARNWKAESVEQGFAGVEDVVKRLLGWDGGDGGAAIFPERLPWQDTL
ncbi:hypothetical protein Tdes44962_MAKER02235 [Teratosphaeria destructans]|uniref:DUF218 domain-containing protein n=1 Tax=Teratosphaeria destructans TaxID=418781 RepID=A0A9W7W3D4_9PEZI|nr:hypothetical protein Tdes44962_MAKER02235 [Teratosphaeria destructans]